MPAMENTLSNCVATYIFISSRLERARILIAALPSPMEMMARFDEVSTTSGLTGMKRTTPLWQP